MPLPTTTPTTGPRIVTGTESNMVAKLQNDRDMTQHQALAQAHNLITRIKARDETTVDWDTYVASIRSGANILDAKHFVLMEPPSLSGVVKELESHKKETHDAQGIFGDVLGEYVYKNDIIGQLVLGSLIFSGPMAEPDKKFFTTAFQTGDKINGNKILDHISGVFRKQRERSGILGKPREATGSHGELSQGKGTREGDFASSHRPAMEATPSRGHAQLRIARTARTARTIETNPQPPK